MELTEKPTFIVEATRSIDWYSPEGPDIWTLQCPGIKGMIPQSGEPGAPAKQMAREEIARVLGGDEDEFDIEIRIMEGN